MKAWPSTTQVLHDAGLYGDLDRFGDFASMRRGRLVDGACNLLAAGKTLDSEWTQRHPECLPFICAYDEFLLQHRPKLIKCAWQVVNRAERYVGHPDQLLLLDGVRALIDIKTGGMPPATPLQLASYEMALYSMGEDRVTRFGLQLVEGVDPTFKLVPFTSPFDHDEFRILVRAFWIRRKYVGEQ